MSTGVYTAATQILTRSNQVIQQVETLLNTNADNSTKETQKRAILNSLLNDASSIGRYTLL